MSYRIEPLEHHSATIFTDYLGNLDFGHAPEWSTCYCRFYHTDCDMNTWMSRSGETNKIEAINAIGQGEMKGFLAFDEDKCIGWLNANDARSMIRLKNEMAPMIKDKKVGCTICYVIHPEYRSKGVARLLLKAAIEHFKAVGYDSILALPVTGGEAQRHYRGSLNMYLENDFKEVDAIDDLHIMWLDLK